MFDSLSDFSKNKGYRYVFKTLSNIYDGVFCKNNYWLKAKRLKALNYNDNIIDFPADNNNSI